MLRYLKVTNLAIIHKVEVEFVGGFNVLTGETGAGKSILIGALNLLLGARASQDLIRTGEEEAHVEALFEIPEGTRLPDELDPDVVESGELVLSRRISRSGRSRCAINGSLATVGMLQIVGRALVSIFGQHEHHVLLDPSEHLEILDRFGGLEQSRKETAHFFVAWKASERDLVEADRVRADLERQRQENSEAIEELTEAALKAGEEDNLATEREILKNAVHIRERAFDAHSRLYARSGSLLEGLAEVRKALDFCSAADQRFVPLRDGLSEAVYRLEDVALEVRGLCETLRADPQRLDAIEERLALIRRLKRKYKTDLPGLIAHLDVLSAEAGDSLDARASVRNLTRRAQEMREAYLASARALSAARRRAGKELEAAVKAELKDLAMPEAAFLLSIVDLGEAGASAVGLEKVEFHLASNPGEEARPLVRVASGGELSRIMLALKALQVGAGGAPTVIFDEVDTGIGGHTAFAVGTRLARVAQMQQVLCITHLHQVAALAGHHLSVRKAVGQGRTHISVTPVVGEERVEELTRMIGALPDSESAREHVRRLMDFLPAEVSQ